MAQQTPPAESDVDEIIVTGSPFGVSERAAVIATDVVDEAALALAPAASLGDLLSGRPGMRSCTSQSSPRPPPWATIRG